MKPKQFKTYEQAIEYRKIHGGIAQSKHLMLESGEAFSYGYRTLIIKLGTQN